MPTGFKVVQLDRAYASTVPTAKFPPHPHSGKVRSFPMKRGWTCQASRHMACRPPNHAVVWHETPYHRVEARSAKSR